MPRPKYTNWHPVMLERLSELRHAGWDGYRIRQKLNDEFGIQISPSASACFMYTKVPLCTPEAEPLWDAPDLDPEI